MGNKIELPKIKTPQADLVLPVPLPAQLPVIADPTNITGMVANKRYWAERTAKYNADREAARLEAAAAKADYDASVAQAKADSEYAQRFLSDYNDTSVANSIGDVIWNVAEDVVRNVLDVLENPSVFTVSKLVTTPITSKTNYVKGVYNVLKDTMYDPIVHAFKSEQEDKVNNWAVVGINALQNLGETADIFANPVKALVIGGEDGRFEALKDSVGWGMEGRKNFDYDFSALGLGEAPTLGLEIVAEVFSDPLTLISIGTTAAAKSAIRKTLQESIQELPKSAAKQVAKVFRRELVNTNSIDGAAIKATKLIRSAIAKELKANGVDVATAVAKYGDEALSGITPSMVRKIIMENNAYNVSLSLTANRVISGLDDAVGKLAWRSSTLFMPYAIKNMTKFAGGRAWNAVMDRVYTRSFKQFYIPDTDVVKLTGIVPASRQYAEETKMLKLLNKIDGSSQPARLAELQMSKTLDHEYNIMKNIYNTTKDASELKSKLDDYVNKYYNDMNTMFKKEDGSYVTGLLAYREYVTQLASVGTPGGRANTLLNMLDTIMYKYKLLIRSEANKIKASAYKTKGAAAYNTLEDIAYKAYLHKATQKGYSLDSSVLVNAGKEYRRNANKLNDARVQVTKDINANELLIARYSADIDNAYKVLDDYEDEYDRLFKLGNEMSDAEFDRFTVLEDAIQQAEKIITDQTDKLVKAESVLDKLTKYKANITKEQTKLRSEYDKVKTTLTTKIDLNLNKVDGEVQFEDMLNFLEHVSKYEHDKSSYKSELFEGLKAKLTEGDTEAISNFFYDKVSLRKALVEMIDYMPHKVTKSNLIKVLEALDALSAEQGIGTIINMLIKDSPDRQSILSEVNGWLSRLNADIDDDLIDASNIYDMYYQIKQIDTSNPNMIAELSGFDAADMIKIKYDYIDAVDLKKGTSELIQYIDEIEAAVDDVFSIKLAKGVIDGNPYIQIVRGSVENIKYLIGNDEHPSNIVDAIVELNEDLYRLISSVSKLDLHYDVQSKIMSKEIKANNTPIELLRELNNNIKIKEKEYNDLVYNSDYTHKMTGNILNDTRIKEAYDAWLAAQRELNAYYKASDTEVVTEKILPVATAETMAELYRVKDRIDEFIDVNVYAPMVSTEAGRKIYQMKGSQIAGLIQLYTADGMPEFMTAAANGSNNSVVPYLESALLDPNLSTSVHDAIKRVLDNAEGMKHFFDLQASLAASGLNKSVGTTVIDTLQRQARTGLDKFIENKSKRIYSILQSAEEQYNVIAMPKGYGLDKLRDKYGFEKYLAHDGVQDVKDLMAIAYQELDMKELINGRHAIWYDLETTGLGTHQDEIYQIAYKTPDMDEPVSINIRAKELPALDVLNKLAPGDLTTHADRISWFRKTYMDAPDLVDEKDALIQFAEIVNKEKNTVLVGHNIHKFDQNMLRDRTKYYDLNKFPYTKTIDTLDEMYKLKGYRRFTMDESDYIKSMIDIYLDRRVNGRFKTVLDIMKEDNLTLDTTIGNRQLVPSPDKYFVKDLETATIPFRSFESISDSVTDAGNKMAGKFDVHSGPVDELSNLRDSLINTMTGLRVNNNHIGRYFIEVDEFYSEHASKFEDVLDWNITRAIGLDALRDGKYMGAGYRMIGDTDLLHAYFNITEDELPSGLMRRMNTTVKSIKNVASNVDMIDLVRDQRDAIISYIDTIQYNFKHNYAKDLKQLSGADVNKFLSKTRNPIYDMDTKHLKDSELFAVAKLMFDDSVELKSGGVSLANQIYGKAEGELLDMLKHPEMLKYADTKYRIADFLDDVLLKDSIAFKGKQLDAELNDIIKSYDNINERMDKIADAHKKFDIYHAEARIVKSIVQDTYDVFRKMKSEMSAFDPGTDDYVTKYTRILEEVSHYGDMIGRESLHIALDKTPEELSSHLLYDAFGFITFKYDDLKTSGMEASGPKYASKALDLYDNIRNNIKLYEEQGVKLFETSDRVWVYLSKDATTEGVLRYSDKGQIGITNLLGESKGGYIEHMHKGLNNLNHYSKGMAKNTAGEKFDLSTYKVIQESIPQEVMNDMMPLEVFKDMSAFHGPRFNRSVLGSVSSKKEVIPYISFNPFKNFSLSAQQLASQRSGITKYTAIALNDSTKLNSSMFKSIPPEDIYNYLIKHTEYRVAEIVENEQVGFKIRTFKIKNKKDFQYALDNNLSVLPEHILNKTMSVVNEAKISNEVIRMVEKYYAGPLKLGYLSQLGFLVRNIIDSTMKNAAVADSFEIIPYTINVWGQYLKYSNIVKDILKTQKDLTSKTINDYFSAHPDLDRKLFELIYTFIKDGPSAGHTKQLQDFFDQAENILYRRRGIETITKLDIKAALQDPEAVTRNKHTPEVAEKLLELKQQEDMIGRAVQMASRSKTNKLDVDTIYTYLERPWDIPIEHKQEFDRLLAHTKKYSTMYKFEKYTDRVVYNKYAQKIMDANGHLEQVFRLTQYLYQYNNGATVDEAISKVIKANFDPIHKSKIERSLDLLFPFASFTTKNLELWDDLMSSKGDAARLFRDVMTPVWDFDDVEKEDLYYNRSLQYMLMAGNIPLQEVHNKVEFKGADGELKKHYDGTQRYQDVKVYTTLKLSTSILDALGFILNPLETIKGRLIVPARLGLQEITLGDVTQEDLLQLIPYYGTYQRYETGKKYYDDTHNIANRVLPSLVGRTIADRSRPDTYIGNPDFDADGNWIGETKTYKNNRNVRKYNTSKSKYNFPEYKQPTYANVDRLYNEMIYRNGEAKMTRAARNLWYNRSDFHRDLFTADSRSRLKLSMLPINPDNVAYSLKSQWSILR